MIKQYEKAKRVLETRWKQREEKRKKRDAELSKSYWFYQDKITNIEKEIRNLLSKQSKEKELATLEGNKLEMFLLQNKFLRHEYYLDQFQKGNFPPM